MALFLPSWPKTATHAEHATSSGAGYVQSFAVSDTFSLIHLYSAEAMRLWIHMQPVDPSWTDINNAGMLPW